MSLSDQDKNRVTVVIMGEEYILRGQSSPEDMYQAGRYVDWLMRNLSTKNSHMNKQKIAVLAALNLADELLRLKDEQAKPMSGSDKQEDQNELV